MGRAIAAHEAGRFKQAERLYRAILKQNDWFVDGHLRLSVVLMQQRRYAEALRAIRRAIAIDEKVPEVHATHGGILLAAGQPQQAANAIQRAIDLRPGDAALHESLGDALRAGEQSDRAEAAYRRAIELDRHAVRARIGLSMVLASTQRLDESVVPLQEVTRVKPSEFDAWALLGLRLRALGRHVEAVECFRTTGRLRPNAIASHTNLGWTLHELGRSEEAAEALEAALALAPDAPEVRFMLSIVRPCRGNDPQLEWLERCAADPARFGTPDHDAWFALARAYRDLGDTEREVEWLLRANAAKRRSFEFDIEGEAERFRRIREVFDAERLERATSGGVMDPTPVFVVGMPRSGSTLIEQILASHPEIHGADELEDLHALVHDPNRFPGGYPSGFTAVDSDAMQAAGREYVRRLRMRSDTAARIVDKRPGNFVLLGAIRMLLPGARIIHCKRDPRDTCTSVFRHSFHGHNPFAYDQLELARYHGLYERLMAHWRSVIDERSLLEVRYEDVVDDLPGQSRRMFEFLGLEWHPDCLLFHRNERPVRTTSARSVRQQIYRDAIGGWQRYVAGFPILFAELERSPGGLATGTADVLTA
jgi:tetratricopeptide (TPR) repeat protein